MLCKIRCYQVIFSINPQTVSFHLFGSEVRGCVITSLSWTAVLAWRVTADTEHKVLEGSGSVRVCGD